MKSSIFISCQSIDSDKPQLLISRLKECGFGVSHSPRNPYDGEDSRWESWYDIGLKNAIHESQLFIIIVDEGWDSSSWMSVEAEEVLKFLGASGKKYIMNYWNPANIEVKANGMVGFLEKRLPNEIDDVIVALTHHSSGTPIGAH